MPCRYLGLAGRIAPDLVRLVARAEARGKARGVAATRLQQWWRIVRRQPWCQACQRARGCCRAIAWHYRPRPKYREPDSWEVLRVDLCRRCAAGKELAPGLHSSEAEFCLRGSDWWDAVDGL